MPETTRSSSRKRKSTTKGTQDETDEPVSSNKGKKSKTMDILKVDDEVTTAPIPDRNTKGELVFPDYPDFRPNLTPEEVIRRGSFGGTYFRPIESTVCKRSFTAAEALSDLPPAWFKGLKLNEMVTSSEYRVGVNTYKVSCGQGLPEWESSGWITPYDPYGWFQWYCRFYLGRRCPDDDRQIKRGLGVMGDKGRWRRFLANKCVQSPQPLEDALHDVRISPKVRQLLQHWGYAITLDALKIAKKLRK